MTNYAISNYRSGFALGVGDYLTISSSGTIGGVGLSASSGSTTVNSGLILTPTASAGSSAGAPGSAGATSATFDQGQLTNNAAIRGGGGGGGSAGASAGNGPTITYYAKGQFGGNGGGGGLGAELTSSVAYNVGTITGGTGGAGGAGGNASAYIAIGEDGGNGAAGGAGVSVNGGSLVNGGLIIGGSGGAGGHGGEGAGSSTGSNGYGYGGRGGYGGVGGDGIKLAGGSITNSGRIVGGAGGAFGHGGGAAGYEEGGGLDGQGGYQGDGMIVTGGGSIVDQSGATISGYDGVVDSGAGGVTLINHGLISGAHDSVIFASNSDYVQVNNNSTFVGVMVGGGATIGFNGGTGSITHLGEGKYYPAIATHGDFYGFGTYEFVGGAQWTLTGYDQLLSSQALNIEGSSSVLISAGTLGSYGHMTLGAGSVIAGYAGASLLNSGTIAGGGSIYGTFALTNGGTIDDDAGSMLINNQSGAGLTNNGLIESASGDALTLKAVTVSGSGSIESFGTNKFDAASIVSGTVNVETGGVLQVASTISTVGTGVTVDNAGSIRITSGAYLYLSSNITGAGSIAIDGVTGTNADLKAVGNVTLSGGGQVSMNVNGFITGYGISHLTNADTITGGGAIFGSMTVTNSGVIDDDAGAMLINNQNGGGLVDTGTLESTATGALSLKDVTVTGSGAIDDDHQMKLESATINGGTITVGSSALFEVIAGTSSLGSAVSITNDKALEVITGGKLTIAGSVTNNGLMETVGTGDLVLSGAVTGTGSARLTGSGSLTIDGAMSEEVTIASTATGDLILGSASHFAGSIDGLSKTGKNAVDLQGVTYNGTDKVVFSGTTTGGSLTIETSASVVLATLTLVGNYTRSAFTLSNDGTGGTVVKDPPATSQLAQTMAGFGAQPASSSLATSGTPSHAVVTRLMAPSAQGA